jgi:hypothetical protein
MNLVELFRAKAKINLNTYLDHIVIDFRNAFKRRPLLRAPLPAETKINRDLIIDWYSKRVHFNAINLFEQTVFFSSKNES